MLNGQPVGATMLASHYIPDVLQESTTLNDLQSRLHGLDHWWRVWKNAEWLVARGEMKGVDMELVALFALFHDAMRLNDCQDPEHGTRGWLLFEYLYDGAGHILTADQQYKLRDALCDHHEAPTHFDPTIGLCWDADRLDIHRKGIWPDPRLMSTGAGRLLAMGRIRPGT